MDEKQYYFEKQIHLAETVSSKLKIYLDTKYWLIFRDVVLGRERTDSDRKLYEVVCKLVSAGVAICPFSEEVLFEVRKQSDAETLTATIRIIDELSTGVCMVSLDERVRLELKNLISQAYDQAELKLLRHEGIWTKAGHCFGFYETNIITGGLKFDDQMAKSLIDFTWNITLCKILRKSGPDNFLQNYSPYDISVMLNEGKAKYAHENTTYQKMYESELAGVVDAYKANIQAVWEDYLSELTEHPSSLQISTGVEMLQNILFHATNKDKIRSLIPSIHILASIHAFTRWDKNRKYKENDREDFNHAIYSLPYCDYFLTEKSLASLVNNKQLGLSKLYSCTVEWRSEEALTALEQKKQS